MISRIIIPKKVLILLALCAGLALIRIPLFGSTNHLYILWNLFLAFLPFAVSAILLFYKEREKLAEPLLIGGGILWLLLIPNAPYVVTDLIHIARGKAALYDTFFFFSAAWVGLLLGMHSISHIEKILRMKYNAKIVSLMIAFITLLIGFGIYLGRFMRWNSWDILTNPSPLFGDIWEAFLSPTDHVLLYVGLFSIFTYLSYQAWKIDRKS